MLSLDLNSHCHYSNHLQPRTSKNLNSKQLSSYSSQSQTVKTQSKMSGNSNVGNSQVYEAGDQRNAPRSEQNQAERFHEGNTHAHSATDSSSSSLLPPLIHRHRSLTRTEDQRSIANRLAAEEKKESQRDSGEQGLNKKDPTAPVRTLLPSFPGVDGKRERERLLMRHGYVTGNRTRQQALARSRDRQGAAGGGRGDTAEEGRRAGGEEELRSWLAGIRHWWVEEVRCPGRDQMATTR